MAFLAHFQLAWAATKVLPKELQEQYVKAFRLMVQESFRQLSHLELRGSERTMGDAALAGSLVDQGLQGEAWSEAPGSLEPLASVKLAK